VRLLVTRPESDGGRTAALLRARGHDVLTVPLLRIEAIADVDLGAGPWAAVLFTSANAVGAIIKHRRFGEISRLPAYVVGARTQSAAAVARFAPVLSADGDVGDLVRLVARDLSAAALPLLYLAGQERAGDLAETLAKHGKSVETAVVYRSVPATDMADQIGTILKARRIDAVLHYSARTAAAFMAAAAAAGARDFAMDIRHFCLSNQVAGPLLAAGAVTVEVAVGPSEEALFQRAGL
jgi:uroporphyrinogen-III synthase